MEELENSKKQDPEMLDIIVLPYELSEQFNSIPPLEEDSLKSIG
jgi:hypothetical protein